MVILNTERLVLRPWRQEDLEDFYAYASEDGVGQMAGWKPHESREESQRILNSFMEGKKTFALEYEGRAVGSLGVERYDEAQLPELDGLRCREIGYVLKRELWGRGLMPEAVEAVIDYLFGTVGLDAIVCGHFLWNTQSGRVQEKCGFKHHSFGKYVTRMNKVEDHEVNLLTREDWLARKEKGR